MDYILKNEKLKSILGMDTPETLEWERRFLNIVNKSKLENILQDGNQLNSVVKISNMMEEAKKNRYLPIGGELKRHICSTTFNKKGIEIISEINIFVSTKYSYILELLTCASDRNVVWIADEENWLSSSQARVKFDFRDQEIIFHKDNILYGFCKNIYVLGCLDVQENYCDPFNFCRKF